MISAPINMRVFKNTIHEWFVNSTGLFTIWADQSAPRPDHSYAALKILTGPNTLSTHYTINQSFDASRVGEEVQQQYHVPCLFEISCQAYVKSPESRDPDVNASSYLNKALISFALLSTNAALNEKNISMISHGNIQNLDQLVDSRTLSRANLDVTFSTLFEQSEYTTYIEKIQLESTSLGVDEEIGV